MGRDQVDAVLLEVVIEAIAVIGPVSDQMFGLGFEHREVEAELDQGDFMMIRRMGADRERQSMAIYNRQNLHAFAAFGEPDSLATALGRCERGINETLAFVDGPFLAQRVCQLGQHLAQDLLLTPLLKPTMHRFVIRIALGQELPLRAGIQNPEHRFQDGAGRDRFATGPIVRNVLFRKVFPNPFPLVVAQAKHARAYRDEFSGRQLF